MSKDSPLKDQLNVAQDPLADALHTLHMSGTFYCRSELSAPWGIDIPAIPDSLMFHVVTSGSCWLETHDSASRQLHAGDFILLPHGNGHIIRDIPESTVSPLFDLPRELLSERYEVLRHGGNGPATSLICGAVSINHPAAQRIVRSLPPAIVIAAHRMENEWVHNAVRFMMAEAQTLRPGGDTIITRVSDILVIQAIRHWLETEPSARQGWLGALQDQQIGQALAVIHREPLKPWTLESLAQVGGMSRSAFAARFMSLVEESPMLYLRRWRMQVALTRLKTEDIPIAELGEELGYQSEAAFNRAFKKTMGTTPGAVRRQARKAAA